MVDGGASAGSSLPIIAFMKPLRHNSSGTTGSWKNRM